MKNLTIAILGLIIFGLAACGNDPAKQERLKQLEKVSETEAEPVSNTPASQTIDLENKGVGPVASIELDPTIDEGMVASGKEVFDAKCSACHKVDKKFIGPSPQGVTERRSPEWIMNMILNPEGMVKDDPLAKNLLIEFNGSPMANQGLTEDEARQILEYFRTLK